MFEYISTTKEDFIQNNKIVEVKLIDVPERKWHQAMLDILLKFEAESSFALKIGDINIDRMGKLFYIEYDRLVSEYHSNLCYFRLVPKYLFDRTLDIYNAYNKRQLMDENESDSMLFVLNTPIGDGEFIIDAHTYKYRVTLI